VFLAADGRRLDRHSAGRIVRTTGRRAGIAKNVTPPHAAARVLHRRPGRRGTAPRCPGSSLPCGPADHDAYDRGRGSLDRHATYIVAAYLAGAAR
jgi:hypothetical protein